MVAVYTGLNVGALTPVGGEGTCQTTLSVTNGVTYKIALDGIYDPGPTELAIRAPAPPPNDAFGAAISLGSGTTFSAAGSTVDASREPGETDPNDSAGSVWYTWAPASSGEATVDTCTSDLNSDPTLTVYTGSAVNTLTPLAASDDNCAAGNGLGSKVTFAASAGTVYRIAVAALCDSCEGGFTLNGSQVVTTPTPPADPPANPPATKKCKKGQKLKKGKCVKKKKKRKKGKK